jgi:asparagine synthase (glutamine-hydrolysing)
LRYLIAVGDQNSTPDRDMIATIHRHARDYHDWTSIVDTSHCYVAYVASNRYSSFELPERKGAILGSMFPRSISSEKEREREAVKPIFGLSNAAFHRVIESRGRTLIEEFWGHYVAVLLDEDKRQTLILRGPVSSVPCLHLRIGTFHLFFSDVRDIASLRLTPLKINWDAITAQVMHTDYLTAETGIKEIEALDGGEAVVVTPKGAQHVQYWNPIDKLAERKCVDFDRVVEHTRGRTLEGAAGLSSLHSHLLVNLSGGLDSSIVLSSLREVAPYLTLSAINSYSPGTGDERRFARRMADVVGCRLLEIPRDDNLDLHCFDDINLTVQPVLNFSAPDSERRTIALAREIGATAVVDGEFGDNIFGSNVAAGALIECFRLHGIGPTLLKAGLDFAYHTRQSVWRVWQLARAESDDLVLNGDFNAVREMQRRHTPAGFGSMILASAHAAAQYQTLGKRFLHPWLQGTRRMAPSAQSLLFGLIVVTSSAYNSPFSQPSDPQRLSPLLTQPLMDLMLRVPAYLHFMRGQNRAAARTAFADRLPIEILERGIGKGGPILWAKSVVDRNAKYLLEYFLDGILVGQGLLDRVKVQTALSPRIEKSTAMVSDLFAKIYIEAWLRKWRSINVR